MAFVSKKTLYAVSALSVLIRYSNGNSMSILEISQKGQIPKNYLEQILIALKMGCLLKSIRGSKGGYILTKKPEDIKLIDIINIMEGGVDIVNNSIEDSVMELFWSDIQYGVEKSLDKSLACILEYQKLALKSNMYYI